MPTPKPLGTLLNAPDYADRVNLIKKIKTADGWRFAPVVPEANGRLKDRVRINGQIEVHPEGAYYIEWRVGGRSGRRYRTAVARDEAIDQARRKAIELRAIRDGLIAGPEPEPEVAAKTTIGDAIDAYLRYVKMQRKPRTHLTYRYTLDTLLRAAYKKKYVEDAKREDVLDFMTYCYELGLGARTVYDKVVTVLQLFKKHGRSSPYMAGGYLFAKTAREILSIDPDRGEVRWSFQPYSESGEWLYASPTFHEGLIYFGDRNGFLHCLEADSGKQIWSVLTNEENHDCNATPIVAEGIIVTATNASTVLAYEPLSGKEVWRQKLDGPCGGPLLSIGDHIAATTHTLSFLDAPSGHLSAQYSKQGYTVRALASSGGRVVSCSSDVDGLFKNAASAGIAEIAVLENGQLVASDQIAGWVITLNRSRGSTLVSFADLEKVSFFDSTKIGFVATLRFPDELRGVGNPEMRDAKGYLLCGDGTVYSLDFAALAEYGTAYGD